MTSLDSKKLIKILSHSASLIKSQTPPSHLSESERKVYQSALADSVNLLTDNKYEIEKAALILSKFGLNA